MIPELTLSSPMTLGVPRVGRAPSGSAGRHRGLIRQGLSGQFLGVVPGCRGLHKRTSSDLETG